MKFYAVALLLALCIVQNTSASLSRLRADYREKINTQVRTSLDRIKASTSGNPAAQKCIDVEAMVLHSDAFISYNLLTSCVTETTVEAEANACCEKVLTKIINQEQVVLQGVNSCIAQS